MAKLILTQEEKDAATYLEWSDEALGKAVKKLALGINDHMGDLAATTMACATNLACTAHDANADTLKMELIGVTECDEARGNWKVTVECLKK